MVVHVWCDTFSTWHLSRNRVAKTQFTSKKKTKKTTTTTAKENHNDNSKRKPQRQQQQQFLKICVHQRRATGVVRRMGSRGDLGCARPGSHCDLGCARPGSHYDLGHATTWVWRDLGRQACNSISSASLHLHFVGETYQHNDFWGCCILLSKFPKEFWRNQSD